MDIIFGKPLLITVGDEEPFLYKDGNLCTTRSGGWEKGHMSTYDQPPTFTENAYTENVTFQSDSILFGTVVVVGNVYFAIRNGRDINFDLFQNIEIEYSSEGAYDQQSRRGGILLPNNQMLKLKGSNTTTTEGFLLNSPGIGRIVIYHQSKNTHLTINSIKLIRK